MYIIDGVYDNDDSGVMRQADDKDKQQKIANRGKGLRTCQADHAPAESGTQHLNTGQHPSEKPNRRKKWLIVNA